MVPLSFSGSVAATPCVPTESYYFHIYGSGGVWLWSSTSLKRAILLRLVPVNTLKRCGIWRSVDSAMKNKQVVAQKSLRRPIWKQWIEVYSVIVGNCGSHCWVPTEGGIVNRWIWNALLPHTAIWPFKCDSKSPCWPFVLHGWGRWFALNPMTSSVYAHTGLKKGIAGPPGFINKDGCLASTSWKLDFNLSLCHFGSVCLPTRECGETHSSQDSEGIKHTLYVQNMQYLWLFLNKDSQNRILPKFVILLLFFRCGRLFFDCHK